MKSCYKSKKKDCKAPCKWIVRKGCKPDTHELEKPKVMPKVQQSAQYFTPISPSPSFHSPSSSISSYKTPQEPTAMPDTEQYKEYVKFLWQKLKRCSDERSMLQKDILILWNKLKMCNQRAQQNGIAAIQYAQLAQAYGNELKIIEVEVKKRLEEKQRNQTKPTKRNPIVEKTR